MADKAYLEAQDVEKKLADALAQVIREKPTDALGRIAQLISPAPAAAEKYLDTVGNTPMIKINKLLPEGMKAKAVYAKLEMQNPGGSIKDRIALNMIEEAEKAGKLKPGMTIVEATSGNTGIGVAMVAAAKGYKCIVMMPQVPPMLERYMIARQFGADVHLTAAGLGAKGLLGHYKTLCASDTSLYFPTDQFNNLNNPDAHVKSTGPEVWAQSSGEVDLFIHGIGTGGTISGVSKFLKSKKDSVKIVAIEPSNARVHVGAPPAPHSIVGIGAGVVTNFLGLEKAEGAGFSTPLTEPKANAAVDVWAHASQEDAMAMAKRACTEEGMMIGPSSGAALHVAMEQAMAEENAGKTIVCVLPSHGIRYTAHPMWAAVKKEAIAALPAPPNMAKDVEPCAWKSVDYKAE